MIFMLILKCKYYKNKTKRLKMSLLRYLQFQPIDPASDQDEITDTHKPQDQINLNDQVDEDNLEKFWNEVVEDIHEDPEWFNFSNE